MTNQRAEGRDFGFPVGVLYVVAAALIILHPADVLLGIFPMRPRELVWRVGTIGAFSGAQMFPLVGFVIASVTAYLLDHRWVQRLLTAVYAVLAVALLVGLVVFMLDAVQLRRDVKPELARLYDLVGVKGMFTLAFLVFVYFALALSSFKQMRVTTKRAARAKQADAPSPAVFSAPAKP
jgi:hypothetical protein